MKPYSIVIRTLLGVFLALAAMAPAGGALPAADAAANDRMGEGGTGEPSPNGDLLLSGSPGGTGEASPDSHPVLSGSPVGMLRPYDLGNGGDLEGLQLVSPGAGWVVLGQRLFWTDNGGSAWRDLTPPDLGAADIRAASFIDAAHGWAVTTAASAAGQLSYGLVRTADGGRTWESQALALFAPDDAARMAGDVSLQFIDTHTGWLVVKQATSIVFDLGTLFKTSDGGDTWIRLSLPAGEPVRFTSALDGEMDASTTGRGQFVTHDGGKTWTAAVSPSAPTVAAPSNLSAVSMATARDAWARSQVGRCEAGICTLVTQLMATHDGGQDWTPVSLPGGQTALAVSSAPASSGPTAPQGAGGLRVTYFGQGFDSCKNDGSLPAPGDMQTWFAQSPYKVWNLYLGGGSLANCGTLTYAYVHQLAQQGWQFIPTWVGPQAPCTAYRSRMDANPSTAYNQGVAEADKAVNVAGSLGLTLSDLSGTVIYYDVEFYRDSTSNLSCLGAVQAFMSGWTSELHATGNQAGVYGAPCGQSLSAFASIPNVPDMLWIAYWVSSQYDPNATVLTNPICGLSNSLWNYHQRLRQYAGGHDETWGNVTYNIDSDMIDGNVGRVLVNCVPGWGQVGLFASADFNGQCAVKSLGDYQTAASLGLPFSSIGSLAVGLYVTATLCTGAFFTGTCQDFTKDVSDLSSTPVGTNPGSLRIATWLALPNHLYIPVVGGVP